ncbi:PREDICTED: putative nuclease HARBI1 [Cyphomyrmex costatus]|uniref:putative nuclease HARBI1 n=1 Tax=Cyphomyrmex costatus TaxID=456900 RepID=UPI000852306F|nr:PREDICTED: putative nuclease HARBI1 [Cyphomyrmex costatus]
MRRTLRDMLDPFALPEQQFIGMYRLSRNMTRTLVQELEPHLPPQKNALAIPNELKVLCALNFYAQGSYQKAVGVDSRLSIAQPTVSIILKQITSAINHHLLRRWIHFPTTPEEVQEIVQRNYNNTRIPGLIGLIDGTNVAIRCPNIHEGLYINRKGFHAQHVQIICDTNLEIINILARYPGSSHDSFVWRNCYARHLLRTQYEVGNHCWMFGDSGYPLEPWLLTPFAETQPGTRQEHFNERHSTVRSTVERCIGVLKKRFRCLLRYRTLEYMPEKAGEIINACAVLHNMCMRANLPDPPEPDEAVMALEDNGHNIVVQPMLEGRAIFNEGQRVRDRLATRLGV